MFLFVWGNLSFSFICLPFSRDPEGLLSLNSGLNFSEYSSEEFMCHSQEVNISMRVPHELVKVDHLFRYLEVPPGLHPCTAMSGSPASLHEVLNFKVCS